MKGTQYVLKGESVDGRYFIVDIFVSETRLPEAGIDFVGRGVGVGNTGDSTRGVPNIFNAVEEFGNDHTSFAAARTGYKTDMPWLRYSGSLFIR